MADNTTLLLIAAAVIGLISVVVGVVIGFILAGLRNSPADSGSGRKDQTEVARLLRNARSGQLGVEVNGTYYGSATALNAAQRKSLVQIHDELQLWLAVEDLPGRIAAAAPPVAPTERVTPPGEKIPPTPSVVLARPASVIPPPPKPAANIRPPSMEMGDILSRVFTSEPAHDAPDAPTTIAGQVDAIIQERLPQTILRDRSIKLKDSPDGGIIVLVDGQKYQGVGDVTDPQVREFIQGCVTEWEKRYGK